MTTELDWLTEEEALEETVTSWDVLLALTPHNA